MDRALNDSSQVDWHGPQLTKANDSSGEYIDTHPNIQPSGAVSRLSGAEETDVASVTGDVEGVELSKRKPVPLETLVELETEDGRVRGAGTGGWMVRWDTGCICD